MSLLVKEEGQVRLLSFPSNWQEEPVQTSLMHGPQNRIFSLVDNRDCKIRFYFRGFPIGTACGQSFSKLLSLPPHALNAEEMDSIAMVIRECSEPENFTLNNLRTEILKGKKILLVEGLWKGTNSADLGLYIDADGSGRMVQEIHYFAPTEIYAKHRGEVLALLSTIEWV